MKDTTLIQVQAMAKTGTAPDPSVSADTRVMARALLELHEAIVGIQMDVASLKQQAAASRFGA